MSEDCALVKRLEESRRVLEQLLGERKPMVGIILGSGLGLFAERVNEAVYVPFDRVPFMKTSTATSHVGRFVCGMVEGVCVLVMQGRLHGYEGYTAAEVAYPVWLMHKLGIGAIITTNAVGAINENYEVGDFCLIKDHINFTGRNPVVGSKPNALAPRFFSLADAYDPQFRELAHQLAARCDIALREGVYLGLLGPSFETPAEIRAFRIWGADTVAMSVCEEVIAARHVGMKVLALSLVSNKACGVQGACPNDREVLEVAKNCESRFVQLMTGMVALVGARMRSE